MTEISRFWNGTTVGDSGAYSDSDFQEFLRAVIGYGAERANSGVLLMSGTEPNDGLKVTANSPATASVNVLRGAALVQGIAYLSDATEIFTPAANASGNPRIDTIVVQADYALQTVRLALLQGTPAASPVATTLTQSAGVMWEIPIADILLASGFTTIAQTVISPRQKWVNAPPAVYLDHVLNNSGVTLNDGDVVIVDTSADRAATTTTTAGDERVLGIWRGQTAAADYGRVQQSGIGYVNAAAAVTRGDALQTHTVAKQAAVIISGVYLLGKALETTSGAGLVLALIRIAQTTEQYVCLQDQKAQNTASGTFTSGAWRTRDLQTEVSDVWGLASLSSNVIALQPGTYRARWSCPAFGGVVRHQCRLQNTSDTISYNGTPEALAGSVSNRSHGEARFRITAAKNFELQHQCATTVATNGFGLAGNFTTEVYSEIEFWREGA